MSLLICGLVVILSVKKQISFEVVYKVYGNLPTNAMPFVEMLLRMQAAKH